MSRNTVVASSAVFAAIAAALFAGTAGFVGAWIAKPAEIQEREVVRAPSPEELEAYAKADRDALQVAQDRVGELERDGAEKERKVRELEGRIARGAEVGAQLRAELEKVKAELEETRELLAVAIEEKEQALEALRETTEQLEKTEAELAVTKEQRDAFREDALYNRWSDFLNAAQLEICDKGNRKRLGNCREAVMATLATAERRDRFAHCIRSGQAQPSVYEPEKGVDLAEYAEFMDQETRQVKGWVVEYCDPTLPERSDAPLAEGRLPATATEAG